MEQLDLRVLIRVIQESILRREPYAGSRGGGCAFVGSFDWHSAVHAHWALLGLARYTCDAAAEAFVLERLTHAALAAERAYLVEHPKFELPYGQAWLLLLLSELSKHPGSYGDEAQHLRMETEERVQSWLEASPFPDGRSPGQHFCAAHDSWLCAFLLTQLSEPVSPGAGARLEALRATKLEPARPLVPTNVHSRRDFLDIPALLATIDLTRSSPRAAVESATEAAVAVAVAKTLVSAAPDAAALSTEGGDSAMPMMSRLRRPSPSALPAAVSSEMPIVRVEAEAAAALPISPLPVLRREECHAAGAAAARIWPDAAAAAATGDEASRSLCAAKLRQLIARPDYWRDDFECVAHWVPQFIWMAVWLAAGRP